MYIFYINFLFCVFFYRNERVGDADTLHKWRKYYRPINIDAQ